MLSRTLPGTDEIEVTLLGGGVGESCVVHLGAHKWMIVDTFREADHTGRKSGKGRPAARVYLDWLGVDRDDVITIVLTHLHADHYRGLDDLLRYYHRATLVIPNVIEERRFAWLFTDIRPDILRDVREAIDIAERRKTGTVSSLVRLGAFIPLVNVLEPLPPGATVTALSPSAAAKIEAANELGEAELAKWSTVLHAGDARAVETVLEDQNLTSIALHVRADHATFILGGDLVNDKPQFGWQAVLDHRGLDGLDAASLLKVPHHGSVGALLWGALTRLISTGSTILIAPFASTSKIPKVPELRLLRHHLGRVWLAAPSGDDGLDDPSEVAAGGDQNAESRTQADGTAGITTRRQVEGVEVTEYEFSGAVRARKMPGQDWAVEERSPGREWKDPGSDPPVEP